MTHTYQIIDLFHWYLPHLKFVKRFYWSIVRHIWMITIKLLTINTDLESATQLICRPPYR